MVKGIRQTDVYGHNTAATANTSIRNAVPVSANAVSWACRLRQIQDLKQSCCFRYITYRMPFALWISCMPNLWKEVGHQQSLRLLCATRSVSCCHDQINLYMAAYLETLGTSCLHLSCGFGSVRLDTLLQISTNDCKCFQTQAKSVLKSYQTTVEI